MDAITKKQVQTALNHFDVLWIGAKKTDLYEFGVSPNKLFEYLFYTGIGFGILLLILSPIIKKLMHGVDKELNN